MDTIAEEIRARVPRDSLEFITAAGELAAERGESLYLVGGTVRDLLLGRHNVDLDLVLEGDAVSLARELARQRNTKVVTHPRFGTATITQGAVGLDIVTARSETYAQPGALPTVKAGTIRDDLFRRDFTINAMAARLAPETFGDLVDTYGGKVDLEAGIVRVLHEGSFTDDPTRIWRAIRYEQRLDFRLQTETERLLRRDLDGMDGVSGDRLRHELERILEEDEPEKALSRAGQLGALRKLSPSLQGNGWLAERFSQARRFAPEPVPDGVVYLALLAWRLSEEEISGFITRLNFGRGEVRVLRDIPRVRGLLPRLDAQYLSPSRIYRLLKAHLPQTLIAAALAADSEVAQGRLMLYLLDLRFVAPALNGNDLKKMGVPEGRKLGALLRALRDARLDGKVTTVGDEEGFVRRWLARSEA